MVKRHIETYDLLREPSDGMHRIIGKIDFKRFISNAKPKSNKGSAQKPMKKGQSECISGG